jgi:hypothetical protein
MLCIGLPQKFSQGNQFHARIGQQHRQELAQRTLRHFGAELRAQPNAGQRAC